MKFSQLTCLCIACAVGGCDQNSRTMPDGTSGGNVSTSAPSDRDNSAVNQRDRDGAVKTPIDQNENQRDLNVTADIRKRLVDSKMSTNAQNVKVITQDGHVTLRGPVKSADEKKRIEEIARDVAGSDKVDSQLEVEMTP